MKRIAFLFSALCIVFFIGCADSEQATPHNGEQAEASPVSVIDSAKRADEHLDMAVTKIAFGSCAEQTKSQPVLDVVTKYNPDLFVYLGDNIYGDSKNMTVIQKKYDELAEKPEFQRLKAGTKIVATWDDHDFGWNDAGRHYPFKAQTKELFLKFFEEPEGSVRYDREGIYYSYVFEDQGKRVQLILLDNRTFRDNLQRYNNERVDRKAYHYQMDYWPNENPDSTFLGDAQWAWLEDQLQVPADVRIIGSGSQFGIEWNGYESWANVPHEQQKMIDLIAKTKAEHVVFITGDVHYAEVSKLKPANTYPIYDFTSSGITSTWHFATPNKNRIKGPVMKNHFGVLEIDWKKNRLVSKIIDVNNAERYKLTIPLSDLEFK